MFTRQTNRIGVTPMPAATMSPDCLTANVMSSMIMLGQVNLVPKGILLDALHNAVARLETTAAGFPEWRDDSFAWLDETDAVIIRESGPDYADDPWATPPPF